MLIFSRYMKFVKVLDVVDIDGTKKKLICTRDKVSVTLMTISLYCIDVYIILLQEVGNAYEMFHTRYTLHRIAYQHKTTNIIEHM